jgi:hypothetical protein
LNKKILFVSALLFRALLQAAAFDFGLVTGQTGEWGNAAPADKSGEWTYTGTYSPWVSSELGRTANLYLSAKVSTVYEKGAWKPEKPPVLAEPGRSEFSWRPSTRLAFEAGRLRVSDPSGFIAAGLFDGLRGSVAAGKARLSLGAFYTGLLYKESAKIVMTSADAERYGRPFDYGDMDSYFASRRVLVSATGEFGDLTPRSSLVIGGLAQFDLNPCFGSADASLHTQYLTARYRFMLLPALALTGTGVAGLAENRGEGLYGHFAAACALDWEVPGSLQDMLQAEIRFAGGEGNSGDKFVAFAPITATAQGQVFTPKLSGLMIAKGTYTARFRRSVSATLEGTYFVRTDGETLSGEGYGPSSSRLLGGEVYGSAVWAPKSDVMVQAGGGAFFPQTGDVFDSDAPVQWKLRAGVVLSF